MEVERLEGELERMRRRLAEVEGEGVQGGEKGRREREGDDATVYVFFFSTVSNPFPSCLYTASNANIIKRTAFDSKSTAL